VKAVVSVYSRQDMELWETSYETLYACRYHGDHQLKLISVTSIVALVSMQPLPPHPNDPLGNRWYPLEKIGLDDPELRGDIDEEEDEDES
jgi:hypothetical protein